MFQRNRLALLACITFLLGSIWRCFYLIHLHPPTSFILLSDVQMYMDYAKIWADPLKKEGIDQILKSPGAFMMLGWLYKQTLNWTLAVWVQLGMALLVPVWIALTAWELYSPAVAALALILAALYFPFIDEASYFMSEGYFLFWMTLTFWLLLRALKTGGPWQGIVAVLAGLSAAITAATRSVILLPLLCVACFLAMVAWKGRGHQTQTEDGADSIPALLPRRFAVLCAGVLLGMAVIMIPLAMRCTRLNSGKPCVISIDGAFNLFMGRHEGVRSVHFHDLERGLYFIWGNPAWSQKGFWDEAHYNMGLYDTNKLYQAAWDKVRKAPGQAFLISLEHVFDLFNGLPWPANATPIRPWVVLYQELYWVFILGPALYYLIRQRHKLFPTTAEGFAVWLLMLPLLGIMLAAFITQGETRYRIPFDAFTLIVAARAYSGLLSQQ